MTATSDFSAEQAVEESMPRSDSGHAHELSPELSPELSVDELAAAAGLTVRTTRYYASLGLIPAPRRRGRMAWYGAEHLARLEMVRALQDHGFTLSAIEGYLSSMPDDARLEDLAVQRAMLTSWTVPAPDLMTRRQLDAHAGRRLTDDEIGLIAELGWLRRTEDEDGKPRYTPVHGFDVAVRLIALDIPVGGMKAAGEAIARHISALTSDLTGIVHDEVIEPWRRDQRHSAADAARLEETIATLRTLTLEAIVAAFQRSANEVIARSLSKR